MPLKFLSDGAAGTALTPTSVSSGASLTVFNVAGSGSVVPQTTVKEHGLYALKHDSAASASAYVVAGGVFADAGSRASVRCRFDHAPDTNNTGIMRVLTAANAQVAEVRLNTAGKLVLYAGASGATLQATGTTTLAMDGS